MKSPRENCLRFYAGACDNATQKTRTGVARLGSESPTLHQTQQIRTVSLRRNCSDLFFTLIIHIETYRRERPNGYPRRFLFHFSTLIQQPSAPIPSAGGVNTPFSIRHSTTASRRVFTYPFQKVSVTLGRDTNYSLILCRIRRYRADIFHCTSELSFGKFFSLKNLSPCITRKSFLDACGFWNVKLLVDDTAFIIEAIKDLVLRQIAMYFAPL